MYLLRISFSMCLVVGFVLPVFGQAVQRPDLVSLAKGDGANMYNRTATPLEDGTRRGVHLDARSGDGVAWIPDVTLTDGIIEVDLRGRNQPGQSFVGLAFHGTDDETFEVVYLRPFNFRAEDPERRSHSVQYISMPDYPWNRLRSESPGTYEAALDPAPDPDAWVQLRVVLDGPAVRVYVNGAGQPALLVERIGDVHSGKVGLWVGNGSEGDFSNLRVTPQ